MCRVQSAGSRFGEKETLLKTLCCSQDPRGVIKIGVVTVEASIAEVNNASLNEL